MTSRAALHLAHGRGAEGHRLCHTQRQLDHHHLTTLLTSIRSYPQWRRRQQQQQQQASKQISYGVRGFHNYFVTHLPSSSLHPDSRSTPGPHHKLPRDASAPHTPDSSGVAPASPPNMPSRDLTVVRIPLRSAKHHFGVFSGRGSRPYNEDVNQAGTINIPAFAKRAPMSLVRSERKNSAGEATTADSPFGDPQVFYFGVFDGHGGSECAEFLRDELHGYIEEAARKFELKSSLRKRNKLLKGGTDKDKAPILVKADVHKAVKLMNDLIDEYKNTIGGYFRRFKPPLFDLNAESNASAKSKVSIESVLTYAFLRADLDFVTAQARKPDPDDPYVSDNLPLNSNEILGSSPHSVPSGQNIIGGPARFKGGSTASIALISTPTPAPFWHPNAHSTIVVAHVGDTRILLCETATGLPVPLTSDHHPSSPSEARRLTRFAESSLVTDSFGEERISGLANSRAFGDMGSKRIGVSAEPELTRMQLGPAQFSFMVLVSDGISGTLSDQEIVDLIKEARTPEEGAKKVVGYATEVSIDGDNATCLVIRLGGWERRSEGGLGSLGTKEMRDARKAEANDPRRGRR
ncbi:hypothetical protein M406DRAFT_38483 [Cryphonectria parasitica EP155]|uniref:PPM-type phosphatase domain-containing protein n=1 Tax=Cryphonectria parasitica (strain ATCC 38755 / EP155) TaxID=660469 RepID=A0A9P5CQB5_CRYP1|nr:uncharacterized protein M406DRAFT_38483 [Cryphonectria parasitica EP155]KAF3766071.1 hypothetical protein M406DRAFT_38483 [Cryphonectria parasitica EP155]